MTWILAIAGFLFSVFWGTNSDDRYYEGWTHCGWTLGGVWLLTHLVNKMQTRLWELAAIAFGAYFVYSSGLVTNQNAADQNASPVSKPDSPRWPRRSIDAQAFVETDGIAPSGEEVLTDLPPELRKSNISSKGAGCCVFRSADHAAQLQGIPAIYRMPEWMVSKGIVGGGYPDKVVKLFKEICEDRGVPLVSYAQHTGGDMKVLDQWMATGRMLCVTYAGRDNRYRGPIDHMVNLVYLDDKIACILDNNFVDKYLWMTRDEFKTRWLDRGGGWAFMFLDSPCPQPPRN